MTEREERFQQLKRRIHIRKLPPVNVQVYPVRWGWSCPYCKGAGWSDERELPKIVHCYQCDREFTAELR